MKRPEPTLFDGISEHRRESLEALLAQATALNAQARALIEELRAFNRAPRLRPESEE